MATEEEQDGTRLRDAALREGLCQTAHGIKRGIVVFVLAGLLLTPVFHLLVPCDPTGNPTLDAAEEPARILIGFVVIGVSIIIGLAEYVRVRHRLRGQRFQYSLRTLFLVVAGAALLLGGTLTAMEWSREAALVHNIMFSGASKVEYQWGRIVHLDFRNCRGRLEDSHMRYVKGLQKLERLEVSGDSITDTGIEELIQMPQLRSVELWGTDVTESGLAKLRAALPQCRIETFP